MYTGLADTYIVTVSKPGCTSEKDTVTFWVNSKLPKPSSVAIIEKTCLGDTLVLQEAITLGVGHTSYWWGLNGRNGFGDPANCFFMPNVSLADTGTYYVTVYNSTPICYSDTAFVQVTTADILTTHPPLSPPTISVTPSTTITTGTPVTFDAIFSNAGSRPKFQWYKNGVAIPGARGSKYVNMAGATILDNDSISVRIIRFPNCVDTAYSGFTKMTITNTGINRLASEQSSVLYPNPNNGTFTIIGHYKTGESVTTCITNAIGQVVYQQQLTVQHANELVINTNNLLPGIYYMSLQTSKLNEKLKLIVE